MARAAPSPSLPAAVASRTPSPGPLARAATTTTPRLEGLVEVRPGRRLWVLAEGGGSPTVVFLHGSLARHEQFAAQLAYLREHGHGNRVVAFDQLGCGRRCVRAARIDGRLARSIASSTSVVLVLRGNGAGAQ